MLVPARIRWVELVETETKGCIQTLAFLKTCGLDTFLAAARNYSTTEFGWTKNLDGMDVYSQMWGRFLLYWINEES